jgi:hypothetical protein
LIEGLCGGEQREHNDTGTDQCIKDHLANLQSWFSKYFPEAERDKYKWIVDNFYADSPKSYEFSLFNKKTILTLSLTLLKKFSFLGSRRQNVWWSLEGSSLTSAGKLSTSSFLSQHSTCETLDFQQWQPSKQSTVL